MSNGNLSAKRKIADLRIADKESRWNVALQASVWHGKIMGLLRTRKLLDITKLSDMDEKQLREFVEILAEHDPEVRDSLQPEDDL